MSDVIFEPLKFNGVGAGVLRVRQDIDRYRISRVEKMHTHWFPVFIQGKGKIDRVGGVVSHDWGETCEEFATLRE